MGKPVNNKSDNQEKLMVLKNLFLEGFISEEEYEKKKSEILEEL